jgi:glycosyltransferase involved in cell wall biosynthesis
VHANARRKPKIVYVVTVPLSAVALLRGQLRYIHEHGFEVVVISSPGKELELVAASEGVAAFKVPMRRGISPLHDVVSLWRLFRTLRELKPDVVNAGTTKAGLLGMVAAWMARVPVRVYTLRGLRLETLDGLKRLVTSLTERLASACAGRVVSVSMSLRQAYIRHGLAPASKVVVLGKGSGNGVDVGRFLPTEENLHRSEALRERLGIPWGVPVVGFVGRFTRDKGITELLDASEVVLRTFPDTWFLLLGCIEDGDPIPASYVDRLENHPRMVRAGFVSDTSPYYHLMSILAFPSHREGFPNAPLEAGAAGVPVAGFAVTGTVDAVVDGETGILVSRGEVDALAETLIRLLKDQTLRTRLSEAARERAMKDFANERVWEEWLTFYERELAARGAYEKG